ncbi:MAG: MFS transporter [Deltaproteobacteria bacterium]|nr:MFS transporter [Deltaproteobacteria bacterium]
MSHPLLRAWYATSYGGIAMLPFMALLLVSSGLSEGEAAALLALTPVGLLVGGPLWAWVADRTGRRGWILRGAAALAAAGGALILVSDSVTGLGAGLLLFALATAPISPLSDALTVQLLRGDVGAYGAIRSFGSVGFLGAVVVGGAVGGLGTRAPLVLPVALLVARAALAWALPSPATAGATGVRPALPASKRLRWLLVAIFLHGIGLATYDTLFTLHLDHLHLPSWVAGVAMGTGVASEWVLLTRGRAVLARVGAGPLLVIALAAGLPRWALTGLSGQAWVMIATQSLHGLQFGAFWLAAVSIFSEAAPEGQENQTQALLTAVAFGAAYLASTGMNAALLSLGGTRTLFLSMTALSLAATLIALAVQRERGPR